MSKEIKIVNDGVNRCRRCDRPLKNPTDAYGWRCAEILGIDNYQKTAATLDDDSLMVYNAYVAKYMGNDTPKRNIATFDADIEKYGIGSKVHTSLVILNECYDMFPQYEHAISELENEIRWIGNQWGSELIEKKVENILKLDAAKNLCTIEQVLAAAYPRQATAVSFSREVADQLTLILYG